MCRRTRKIVDARTLQWRKLSLILCIAITRQSLLIRSRYLDMKNLLSTSQYAFCSFGFALTCHLFKLIDNLGDLRRNISHCTFIALLYCVSYVLRHIFLMLFNLHLCSLLLCFLYDVSRLNNVHILTYLFNNWHRINACCTKVD